MNTISLSSPDTYSADLIEDFAMQALKRRFQILLAFTTVLFLWAYFSPLEELTRTDRAMVVPIRQMQTIQSLEGGIIKRLCVQEGQVVTEGEILAEIDDLWAQTQLEKNTLQIHADKIHSLRILAEMNDEPFNVPEELHMLYPEATLNEKMLYDTRRQEYILRMQSADHELAQLDQQILQERSEYHYAQKSYDLKEQEFEMIQGLEGSGAISPQEYLQHQRMLGELKGLVEQTRYKVDRSLELRRLVENRKQEYQAQYRKELAFEYHRTQLELQHLEEEHLTLQDREQRTILRAPMNGTINKVYIHTQGGILRPGETLFDLVPMDDHLIIEARIQPKDIGFIRKGMKAHVKVSAFDYSLFGGLEGEVEHISPDVLIEHDQPYYLVRITTNKHSLTRGNQEYPIIPGMTASVDILTGHRTVMQYLMKPIMKAKQVALTER
ncbi:MAG: HlyD family type I secretion periplasmic adaptor subunit [Gammaproteobacteria bacterium]|nr:HlyD family type I secretion periplasmic adaptor subunit [Gammaproteobacteria bacterium]